MVFDLNKIDVWMPVTASICKQLVSDEIREDLRGFDSEDMFNDTMEFLLESISARGEYQELESLHEELDHSFLGQFSHIRGFHSCRPIGGIKSYEEKGIRKLSRPLLHEIAQEAFKDYAAKEAIAAEVDAYEIIVSNYSVYLFTDDKTPLDRSCNHYLQSGSEMLHAIAYKLNIGGQGIMRERSKPYLIECRVPLTHVAIAFRYELWRTLMTFYFRAEAGAPPPNIPIDFCIRTTKPIAPEAILEFHSVDETGMKYNAPAH